MTNNRINFTKKALEAISPSSEGKRLYVYDTKEPGLVLQITKTGRKSFQLYKKHLGKPLRVTIGTFPDHSVEQARKKARALKTDIDQGKNPNDALRGKRLEMTFSDLFDIYLERHAKQKKRTWREDQAYYNRHLRPLGKKRLSQVSRKDISAIHASIGKTKQTHANRVLALISSIFGRAIEFGFWEEQNPCRGIKKFPEKSRDRFLNADEMARFFKALQQETNPTARDYFLISLLTGARRSNVLSMKWSTIDFYRQIWTIQDTKSGTPQTVQLTDPVIKILQDRKQITTSDFVFPGIGKTGHLVEPKSAWKRICKAASLEDVRIHDLRRTFGSWQALTGASLPVIGRSLNHQNQSTTAIYARLTDDPVRASVEKATAAMLDAAEKQEE